MTSAATIKLATKDTIDNWQSGNLLRFVNNEIEICVDSVESLDLRTIQIAGRKIESLGVEVASLQGNHWSENAQWAFTQGFTKVGKLQAVRFCGDADMVTRLQQKQTTYAWARDLINQTPSQLVPQTLAQQTVDYLTSLAPDAINVTTVVGEELEKQGWTGIYNVGKGSVNPPLMLTVDYNPGGDTSAPVHAVLVGKGITFDSGGYSIKPSAGMFSMKCDMGGAATAAAAMALAIQWGLDKRVKLILCCAENMISDHAYKLGDILTYKNGTTVEIANTDAEGRLVLADGLIAASEDKPQMIIDSATLTGAAMLATGGEYNALFSMDKPMVANALMVACEVNDPAWPLPLEGFHQGKCPSAFADTANSTTQKGGGGGGASNAAGFLARFVEPEGKGWLHIDLSACYHERGNSMWAAGATGSGIATITGLIL